MEKDPRNLENESIQSQQLYEKNNIQVSNQLLEIITEKELTVEALRIMFTYMSLIDPHKPECTLAAFRLHDYANLFGAKKKPSDMTQALMLLSNLKLTGSYTSELVDLHVETRNLFEYCSMTHLKGSSDVHLIIACTKTAVPIFFELEQRGYLKVYMSQLSRLRRKNSILLYLLLMKNTTFTKNWTVALTDLYELLNVTDEYRAVYKNFNAKILKPVCEEINEKTGMNVSYEAIKRGRFISELEFVVEKKEEFTPPAEIKKIEATRMNPIDYFRAKLDDESDMLESDYECYLDICPDSSFTKDDYRKIDSALKSKIPKSNRKTSLLNNEEFVRIDHLDRCYKALLEREKSGNVINSRLNYLLKVIEKTPLPRIVN